MSYGDALRPQRYQRFKGKVRFGAVHWPGAETVSAGTSGAIAAPCEVQSSMGVGEGDSDSTRKAAAGCGQVLCDPPSKPIPVTGQ